MNHLYICSAGITRSQEAVLVARELSQYYEIEDFSADYFGLDSGQNPSPELFEKYDLIIVMEESHKKDMVSRYQVPESKIKVLDIPDEHSRSESKLRKILDDVLLTKLEPIFQEIYRNKKNQSPKV